MQSEPEPESESEPSSTPNFFCDGAASAAAAVSSRLPIDGEEMIIKTEEISSSSTESIPCVKVKKEEEEVVDDEGNNHNDGTSASASASASNMNYNLNRSVKKEEENDNDAPNDDGDYDYSDWKVGNWCLLLPATDNSKNRQEQPGGDGAIAVTTKTDVTSTTTDYSNSGTKRSASQLRYINDVTNECETAATAGPDVDPSPRRKTRRKENGTDKDDNSNIKIASINHETDNNVDIGIDIKEKVEEGCSDQHNVNATVDDNDNTNSDDSSTNSNNDNNSDDDDGYESWTEGNWCLLLSPVVDGNDDKTKNNSSSKLSVNTKSTNTCKRRRSSRHHSCGLSSTHLEVNGIDTDEDDTMYDDEDDTPMGDEDDNDEPTKRTQGTIPHKKWNEMFQKLVTYKKEHKSAIVPVEYARDLKLGNWVSNQRSYYKNKTLFTERIHRLESIGFVWDTYDAQWTEFFHKLVSYKKEHKSTNVPNRYAEDDHSLGKWVSNQRTSYTKNDLSIERINRLESIGFVWDPLDAQWRGMYSKLVAYKKQNESTQVPFYYTEDPPLGKWVHTQRTSYSRKGLLIERINLLESIGFVWHPMDAQWMGMYIKLVAYKKQNKSTQVPTYYAEDPPLGIWVFTQRKSYKCGKPPLSEKRLKLLNSINFTWSIK